MCATKLNQALNDCLISFDCRVLLTDLINEYHMSIEEVSRTLNVYLGQQEKEGVKYEKRYVVHGMDADDSSKEVFQIVKGESMLNDWKRRLKGAESSLYSVEVEGGAKPPAEDLKPVTWCAIMLQNLEKRKKSVPHMNGNATQSTDIKTAVKVETKSETKLATGIAGAFGKTKPMDTTRDTTTAKDKGKEAETTAKASSLDKKKTSPQNTKKTNEGDAEKNSPKKISEQKKPSPKDKKAAAAASGQKGIGNFFAPKNKGKEAADSAIKTASSEMRQKTPHKLNDYFKKQCDKPSAPKEEEKKANTSTQLFVEVASDEEEKEGAAGAATKHNIAKHEMKVEVVVESSDEEEELNKIRRKVEDADLEEAATSSRKRLRIEDSDDEDVEEGEEPQKKQEKLDETVVAEVEDSPPKSETYLDEDGFVITVKSKKRRSTPATPASSRQKTPTKRSPKEKKSKQTPKPATKTKQGNIMNFFKKK